MTRPNVEAFVRLGQQMQADVDAILPPAAADSHATWSVDMHLRVALDELEQAISKAGHSFDADAVVGMHATARQLRYLVEIST